MSNELAGQDPPRRGLSAAVARVFSSFGVPAFRRYAVGAQLAYTGSWMVQLTQSLMILELSARSGTLLGVTLAIQALPLLVLGPWAGLLADRVGARRMLIAGEVAMLIVSMFQAVLIFLGSATVVGVLVLAGLFGMGAVMEQAMRTAVVAELVPQSHLANAVSLNALLLQLGRFLGPAAAGFLISASGYAMPFALASALFGAFAVLLATISSHGSDRRLAPRSGGLGAALAFITRDPALPEVFLLAAVGGLVGPNFVTFATLILTTDFEAGPAMVGAAAMFLAGGTISGALVAAWRNETSVPLVRIGALGVGAAAVLGWAAPQMEIYMATLAFAGFFAMMLVTQSGSAVQARTPPGMRGRVSAIFSICLLVGVPVGAPLFGATADVLGSRPASAVLGGTVLVAVVVIGVLLRKRNRPLL